MHVFYKTLRTFLLLYTLAVLNTAIAQQAESPPLENGFDVEHAQKEFHDYTLFLAGTDRTYQNYVDVVVELEDILIDAQHCVADSKARAQALEGKLEGHASTDPQSKSQKSSIKYIKEKRDGLLQRASDCDLLVLRIEEALPVYKKIIKRLGHLETYTRSTPIWGFETEVFQQIQHTGEHLQSWLPQNIQHIYFWGWWLLGLFALSVLSGWGLARQCRRLLPVSEVKHRWSSLYIATLGRSWLVLTLFSFGVLILGFAIAIKSHGYIEELSAALMIFAVYLTVLKAVFSSSTGVVPPRLSAVLYRRAVFQALTVAMIWVLSTSPAHANLPPMLFHLLHTVLLSLVVLTSAWFVWGLMRLEGVQAYPLVQNLTKTLIWVLVIFILFLEMIGYRILAVYFLKVLVLSAAVTVIFYLPFKHLWPGVFRLLEVKVFSHKPLKYYLGLKSKETFWEAFLLIYLVYFTLLGAFVVGICLAWQVPDYIVWEGVEAALHGFTVAGISVVPLKLGIAIFSFAAFNIIGRILAVHILHQVQKQHEMRTQTALGSIVRYLSFVVALFLSFFIVDVDFSSLALVLGALAVGIGLGLKDIVNNLISGLILLIEKPLRQGDRIIMKDIEGYVHKIGLRSTRVTTDEGTEVVIPNKEIVSNPLTNGKFEDRYWWVKIKIGIAYGSQSERVQDLLLTIARQHPQITQEAPHDPKVRLVSLEDDVMLFELSCVIRDPSKKLDVKSDLYLAIDKVLRENKIALSFPKAKEEA